MFDPDPDSDPEKTFEKPQTFKLMTLCSRFKIASDMSPQGELLRKIAWILDRTAYA
jgi:hypothetical protein